MVNPVSGNFTAPLSTTFQPGGGNTQAGTTEQRPEDNRPQPAQAAAAGAQQSNQSNNAPQESPPQPLDVANESHAQEAPPPQDSPRGSLVDIEA